MAWSTDSENDDLDHLQTSNLDATERKHLAGLIDSIKRGDIESVCQILDAVTLRTIHKFQSHNIPPMIWAVKRSRKEIIKLLIARGMNVNQQGFVFVDAIVITLTPLLEALRTGDKELVAILLSAGADPYRYVSKARISAQREGLLGWLYPITEAIGTDNVLIVKMIMERFNPRTPICIDYYQGTRYMEEDHTCLCFALSMWKWRKKNSNWYEIVKCIIAYGGILCDRQRCSQFDLLVGNLFSKSCEDDGSVRIQCNFSNFRVLKLIFKTQNTKLGLDVVKSLEESGDLQSNNGESSPGCGFACEKSEKCFQYIQNYLTNPTSLKQTCRVVVRHSARGSISDVCSQLPLPPKLQKYVGTMDED